MLSKKEASMFKKTFFLMLSVVAILPFAGSLSAATPEIKADNTIAWFWGNGWGFGGYSPYYSYGGYGYGGYPYYYGGYGGCGYGGC
jgi:hypothetical protein